MNNNDGNREVLRPNLLPEVYTLHQEILLVTNGQSYGRHVLDDTSFGIFNTYVSFRCI